MSISGKSNHTTLEKTLPAIPNESGATAEGIYSPLKNIKLTVWIWESLSLLLSMLSMGMIIVLLFHFDNKPLPTWNCGLTLNGIISLLSVVAKSSLVLPVAEAISQLKWHWFWSTQRPVRDFDRYDGASRGPWGCLRMLCNVRLWSFGAVGATLMLASLAVEPFLQQILTYPTRSVISGEVEISRTINYSNVDGKLGETAKGAVYVGVFGTKNTTSYAPTCPTGNCTWPSYSSLGVCSACNNLDSRLYTDGRYWAPTNGTRDEYFYWFAQNSVNQALSMVSSNNDYPALMPMTFRGATNQTILDLVSLYWPNQTSADASVFPPPSAAFECILYFCVKSYTAATVNGEFTEILKSTWPPADQALKNELWPNINTNLANETLSDMGRGMQNYTLQPPDSTERFVVDILTFEYLRLWMANLFSSSTTSSGGDASNDITQAFFDAQSKLNGPNKAIKGYKVPSNAGPGQLLEQVANSFDTHLRQVADAEWAVLGNATSVETFVQARWYWAILPVSLLLLALVFMAATITKCTRNGVPIWKSSSLAILLHGVDEQTCSAIMAENLGDIEVNANHYAMRMKHDQKPWMLEGSQVKFATKVTD